MDDLSRSEFSRGIIEFKVFAVMFVFNFVEGFYSLLAPYIPLYLHDMGYSAMEISVFNVFVGGLRYVVSPILFFIVLYLVCGGKLLDRIAGVLISLILGSLLGFWVGGVLGIPFLTGRFRENLAGAMLISVSRLPYISLGQMLFGFAVLAFFDVNKKWIDALSMEKLQGRRPDGVVILSVLYLIFGVFNICVIPILLIHPLLLMLYTEKLMLFVGLISFLALNGLGQVLIAVGLYFGRKWGWIPALISVASSLLATVTVLLAVIAFGMFINMFWWTILSLVIGFVISLIVVFYLLSFNVRQYFGLVSPSTPFQNK